jgi:hypothetical protein
MRAPPPVAFAWPLGPIGGPLVAFFALWVWRVSNGVDALCDSLLRCAALQIFRVQGQGGKRAPVLPVPIVANV